MLSREKGTIRSKERKDHDISSLQCCFELTGAWVPEGLAQETGQTQKLKQVVKNFKCQAKGFGLFFLYIMRIH